MEYKCVIQYSILFGCKALTKLEVVEAIKTMPREESLMQISRLLNWHNNLLIKDGKEKLSQYKDIYYEKYLSKNDYNKEYFNNNELFCTQTLLLAYKWVVCYSEKVSMAIDYNPNEFNSNIIDLLLVLGDFIPQDIKGQKTEFLWSTLYLNSVVCPKYEIARAYYMIKSNNYRNEYRECFVTLYDITIEQYLVILFNFIMNTMGKHQIISNIDNFNAQELTNEYIVFVNKFTISLDNLKAKLLNKNIDNVWDYSELFVNPLVKIDGGVMPIAGCILYKVFFEYLFWKIGFAGKELKNNVEPNFIKKYKTYLGKTYENYIYDLCKSIEKVARCEVLGEFKLEENSNELSSDVYIRFDDLLIIVEVKAKSPNDESYYMTNDSFEKAKIDLLIAPICQADRCYQKILNQGVDVHDFKKRQNERIYILSVSMEKVQPVQFIMADVEEAFKSDTRTYLDGDKRRKTKLSTPNIAGWLNMNTYEFEKFCIVLENKGKDAAVNLLKKTIQNCAVDSNPVCKTIEEIMIEEKFGELESTFVENNYNSFCSEVKELVCGSKKKDIF